MVTATTFTLFKANIQRWRPLAATTKEVAFVVSFVLALNKVNIVAVTTILVLHVGDDRSEHVRLDIMFLAIRAACSMAVRAMRRGIWGATRPPNGVIPILGLGVDGVSRLMSLPYIQQQIRCVLIHRHPRDARICASLVAEIDGS